MSVRSLRRRRQRTLLKRLTVLGVGAATATTAWPQETPASAFYTVPDTDCTSDFQLEMVGSNWGSRAAQFADGGRLWNDINDPDGNPSANAVDGSSELVYAFREELGGNSTGRANCNTLTTYLDDDISAGGPTEAVGVHEIGHLIGMEHTGDGDNIIGSNSPPAMSTCRMFTTAELGPDDHAQLLHMDDPVTSLDTSSADVGFENQHLNWWGRSGLNMTLVTGDAFEGDTFAELEAQSNHDSFYLYQTMRLTDPQGEYGFSVGYKDGSSSTTGEVGIRISSREVEYPYQDPADCGYFSDLDLNRPSVLGALTFRTPYSFCPTYDDWIYCSARYNSVTTWEPPSGWDAADVRLTVYKDTNGPMWVDGVRLKAMS